MGKLCERRNVINAHTFAQHITAVVGVRACVHVHVCVHITDMYSCSVLYRSHELACKQQHQSAHSIQYTASRIGPPSWLMTNAAIHTRMHQNPRCSQKQQQQQHYKIHSVSLPDSPMSENIYRVYSLIGLLFFTLAHSYSLACIRIQVCMRTTNVSNVVHMYCDEAYAICVK